MERNQKPNGRRPQRHRPPRELTKVDKIINDVQKELQGAITPVAVENLNAFERKQIHSYFDRKSDFKTKTYRNGEEHILKIYPVANLCRLADKRATQVMETGESFYWENLGNFERFIIHNHLKNFESVETISHGEGESRMLEIKPKQFGRSLKRIIKKIKLF
jgi:predicted RNA-binding protein Jag